MLGLPGCICRGGGGADTQRHVADTVTKAYLPTAHFLSMHTQERPHAHCTWVCLSVGSVAVCGHCSFCVETAGVRRGCLSAEFNTLVQLSVWIPLFQHGRDQFCWHHHQSDKHRAVTLTECMTCHVCVPAMVQPASLYVALAI